RAQYLFGSGDPVGRRYRCTPAGASQDPSLLESVKRWVVPSPSVNSTNLFAFPAIWSALFGWMSIGFPNRFRLEIASDQLFPAGQSHFFSSALYVRSSVVSRPRPGSLNGSQRRIELPLATLTSCCMPAPMSRLT